MQINAKSLIRKQLLLRRKFFDSLFTEGLTDFFATDTHAMPGRETCLTQGIQALREKYGETVLQRIEKNLALFPFE